MNMPSTTRVSPECLQAAVEGRAGWRVVQSVLTDPLRHGGTDLLDQLPRALEGRRLQLVRSKYKPGRKLTAYYRTGGTEELLGEDLAVSWQVDGRVRVLQFPADPDLPQLARLSDPAELAAVVETLCGSAYPLPVIRTVRYRPGQRHVLQARCSPGPTVYVKTDRDDSGARAVPVARFLTTALRRRCTNVRVAQPLGHAAPERASLWWQSPGVPASAVVSRGRGGESVASLAGRVARAIHDCPADDAAPPGPAVLGRHDVHAEAAATLRAGEHISALLPSVGRTYGLLVAVLLDELSRQPAERATLIHGDLKADNLLVDGELVRVLDVDRARWAEPALDLGKFLADLRWWSPSARAAALEAAFRDGYGSCDPRRWARAELLASLLQLKLAARRAVLHEGRWQLRVHGQVVGAVEAFARTRTR